MTAAFPAAHHCSRLEASRSQSAAPHRPHLRSDWLVMNAIESNMAQPAAALMRLILIKFSTGVGRRVSKSSNFAHRGSMVIRTIC
jgi:hypothetical protein